MEEVKIDELEENIESKENLRGDEFGGNRQRDDFGGFGGESGDMEEDEYTMRFRDVNANVINLNDEEDE